MKPLFLRPSIRKLPIPGLVMLRHLKLFSWAIFLAAVVPAALAFSLDGPLEGFQTQANGYIEDIGDEPFPPNGSGPGWWVPPNWSTAPKNLGEEFRWNMPVLYYAFDQSFLEYFGSNGVAAVESAIAMLNALPPVSEFSPDLSEFPTDELRYNYTAASLHMFDLKSAALELLVERLGLIDANRWVWCIRNKIPTVPTALPCPSYFYQVIQRSFDPITYEPSAYINGFLYTYTVQQVCPPAPVGDSASTRVIPVDPFNTPVGPTLASLKIAHPTTEWYGAYHTSLTQDDAGGLRYLYRAGNVQMEALPAGATAVYTNLTQGQPFYSSNLTFFAQQALTNSAAGLTALYPGLAIITSTNYPVVVWTTNLTAYFTNSPYDPAGSPPQVAFTTNATPSVELHYSHTYGNLVTVKSVNGNLITVPIYTLDPFVGRAFITLLTSNTTTTPFIQAGGAVLVTNATSKSYLTNEVVGEFFLLPTNSCGLSFAFPLLTNILTTTNLLASAFTNITITTTNSTNTGTPFFSQSLIQYFTNHIYWGYNVTCLGTNTEIRQGIEKITFIRRDYDSLLGQFFAPITNSWVSYTITNNTVVPETVFRTVTRPDILFQAADLSSTGLNPNFTVARTAPVFNTNAIPNNPNAGPGVLEGQPTGPAAVIFTFNKVGTSFYQGLYPAYLDQAGAYTNFVWASFDGSTNAPFIYPSGASIENLYNMMNP